MSFEWQTEEDSRWDEDVAPPEPPKRARRRWPWWLLLGVLLVGTAVFLVYRQLNQRVETATENVEADLLASYAVLQRAAQNRDEILFGSLISGRDDEWSQAQRDLLNAGLLFLLLRDCPAYIIRVRPSFRENDPVPRSRLPGAPRPGGATTDSAP